jgi:hypothetical protein
MESLQDYFVTPYDDGCAIERAGEGIISLHPSEWDAVRRACELASRSGGDVLVREPQAGCCGYLALFKTPLFDTAVGVRRGSVRN